MFMVAQSGFTLTAKDCATVKPVRQFHVYLYYIATCSIGTGTGGACQVGNPQIPTLKRAELVAGGTFDLDAAGRGHREHADRVRPRHRTATASPDLFKANPASVAEWSQVVAMRLNLLARNTDVDARTTRIPRRTRSATTATATDNDSTPGGGYRRHNYKELVRVQNVSQRTEASFP